MAELIQEISPQSTSPTVFDKKDTKTARPIPAKRRKRSIIKPNLDGTKSYSSFDSCGLKQGDSSNAVKPKQPPPRPSGPPSRQGSISKSETLQKKETITKDIKDPAPTVKAESKITRRRPEITVLSARPLSDVVGFGKGAEGASGSSTRLSLNMDNTPAGPPPLPSTRPKGKYVPPPLPTSRPKAAYIHPVSIGSTPSSGSSSPEQKPAPFPKPRSNSVTQDKILNNHVNVGLLSNKPSLPPQPVTKPHILMSNNKHALNRSVSQKTTLASKPHIGGSTNTGPVAVPKQRTSVHNSNPHLPVLAKPSVASKPCSPPKQTTSMSQLLTMIGSGSSTQPKPAAKPQQQQQNSSSFDLGWKIASGIADNITAKDVQRAAGAVSSAASSAASSETARKFGNAAVKTASSSSDPHFQIAGSVAQNINAKDVSKAADTVGNVAASEQGQKAASNAWNFVQNNKEMVNTTISNSTQSKTSTTKSSNNFDLLGDIFSSTSSKPATAKTNQSGKSTGQSLNDLLGFDPVPVSKPKPSAGLLPPPEPSASKSGIAKSRPTIIRPGAKSSSRSASPKIELEGGQAVSAKSKKPPPRPNAGPQKRTAPPRPVALGSKKQAPTAPGNSKSKRVAPTRPAPGIPGPPRKSSKDLKSTKTPTSRPGLGHTLYKDTSSMDITGPQAVARHSYDGTSPDDLSFQEGDIIKLQEKISDDWYRGECRGQAGLFPVTFVEIIEDIKPSLRTDRPYIFSGPRCTAKFEYSSGEPTDLTFKSGAVIRLLEHVGNDWLKGELRGKTGIFPCSFVDIVEDVGMHSSTPSAVNGTSDNNARALFDFDAGDSTEISLKEGDLVTVLNQINSEWLYGEVRGQKGRFPASYIDHVPANLSVLSTPTDSSPSGSNMGGDEIGIAQFDFDAGGEGEMSIRTGDTIAILEHVGDDWLRGRLHGREGLFPKTFVEISGTDSGFSSSRMVTAKALFDFIGETADELTFKTGDTITQIKATGDEWWEGQLNSKKGRFPRAFVEVTS